jgi:hypothetical protein
MRKIAGNRDVPVIQRHTSRGLQALDQVNIAIGLRVVFTAGVQGAGAEWHSQDVISRLGLIRMP